MKTLKDLFERQLQDSADNKLTTLAESRLNRKAIS